MSETRALIAETAERLFRDLATKEVIEAAEQGDWPGDLWSSVEETGLTQALVHDAESEDGPNVRDAGAIVRAAGKYAAPIPLPETLLAGWLLSSAGLVVPEGPLTIAPVERAHNLVLSRSGEDWTLSGTARGVPWARHAKAIAVLIGTDGESLVACLEPGLGRLAAGANLAGEPRDDVTFEGARLADDAVANANVDDTGLRRYGALMRSVQMAGALERLLDLSTQYALDRVQFGRPIAKFQAIQHALAVLGSEVAAAGAAADGALSAADRGDAVFAIAAAKARTGEAAGRAAAIAHQVHGAMGFTHEHVLHHSTRRLWSWRDEFGRESEWTAEIGRAVAAAGADQLWPFLTSH